jgi:hypothetical protein
MFYYFSWTVVTRKEQVITVKTAMFVSTAADKLYGIMLYLNFIASSS